ncbi:MAG: hypothetical protein WEF50_05950 [Myxococcota bacterium]
MTERTDALIGSLARGLRPVRRLPPLGRVAFQVVAVGLGLAALHVAFELLAKQTFPKPSFAAVDAWTIAAHALLALGALAFALGACVPGRERLVRSGSIVLAVALAAIAWIGLARLEVWLGADALGLGWLGRTLACSLGSIAPAAIPALLLARFAARAAPRRVTRVLLLGSAASLALLTPPGILGCGYPDELHHALGHLLTPALGAVLLLALALPVYLSARPKPEA